MRATAIKLTIHNYQRKADVPSPVPETPMTPFPTSRGYGFPDASSPVGAVDSAGGDSGSGAAETEATMNFKPSMLLDVEAGRPAELEPIIGSLLDRARAKGVPTPRLDVAYSVLKVHQEMAIQTHAQSPQHQEHIKKWLARKPNIGGLGASGNKAWHQAVRRAGLTENALAGGKDKVRKLTAGPFPLTRALLTFRCPNRFRESLCGVKTRCRCRDPLQANLSSLRPEPEGHMYWSLLRYKMDKSIYTARGSLSR